MTLRSRSLNIDDGGTIQKVGSGAFGPSPVAWKRYIASSTDVIGDYGGIHGLTLDKVDKQIECFNGNTKETVFDGNYMVYNHIAPAFYQTATFGHVAVAGTPSEAASATKMIARSNPSRAAIDLPISLVELKELPELFHLAGKHLLRKGSSAFLSYQYGWKPLIRDVKSLLDFSTTFKKRMKEVTRIIENGGVRYRQSLGTWSATGAQGPLFISSDNGDLIQARSVIQSRVDMWATVRWLPITNVSSLVGTPELENRVRKAIGGLQADLSTTWNLIPWSWLIDWCGTMGDFLAANRVILPFGPTACCVMTHTYTTHSWTPTYYANVYPFLSGGAARILVDTKRRSGGLGASVTADIPMLSGRQASILGALGIQRVPRGILR